MAEAPATAPSTALVAIAMDWSGEREEETETNWWDLQNRMELVAKHLNLSLEILSGVSST
jgi:hypothetical protein